MEILKRLGAALLAVSIAIAMIGCESEDEKWKDQAPPPGPDAKPATPKYEKNRPGGAEIGQ